jgi:hypothetical protein
VTGAYPPTRPPCQVFKAEAHYVGSKIDIYALKERPEFAGHYRRVHKGAVVLALSPRDIPEQCETEVGCSGRQCRHPNRRRRHAALRFGTVVARTSLTGDVTMLHSWWALPCWPGTLVP